MSHNSTCFICLVMVRLFQPWPVLSWCYNLAQYGPVLLRAEQVVPDSRNEPTSKNAGTRTAREWRWEVGEKTNVKTRKRINKSVDNITVEQLPCKSENLQRFKSVSWWTSMMALGGQGWIFFYGPAAWEINSCEFQLFCRWKQSCKNTQ